MSNQSEKPVVVACPTCGTEVKWNSHNKFRPFCSERCKLMDLGEWAAERYRVVGDKANEESASTSTGAD